MRNTLTAHAKVVIWPFPGKRHYAVFLYSFILLIIQTYGIFAIAYSAAKAKKLPNNIKALATVVGVLVEVLGVFLLLGFANRGHAGSAYSSVLVFLDLFLDFLLRFFLGFIKPFVSSAICRRLGVANR